MTGRRFVRFTFVSGLGIAIQIGALSVLIHAVPYVLATVGAVACAIVHNFVWHWHWTWADRARANRRPMPALLEFAAGNGVVSLVGNVLVMLALVGVVHAPPVAANLAAIACCGLLNFVVADRWVFRVVR